MTSTLRTSSVHLVGINTADLGEFTPKPTAVTPGQAEAAVTVWSAPDKSQTTGVWEAEPGIFTAFRDGYHEICVFTAGHATIQPEGEEPFEVRAGDLLVMPAGWRGTWHVHETVRKAYVNTNAPSKEQADDDNRK